MGQRPRALHRRVAERYGVPSTAVAADITKDSDVDGVLEHALARHGRIDGLINNAANNPTIKEAAEIESSRLETFSRARWDADVAVGLTGAFLCSRILGTHMARQGKGVIVNIASDLALIGPDQRLYRRPGLPEDQQPVKPVTYSVVKTGLIGFDSVLGNVLGRPGCESQFALAWRGLRWPADRVRRTACEPNPARADGAGR